MTAAFLRRVVPLHADLLFFIDGHETCVPLDVPTRLPDADDPTPDDGRWYFPIKAHRPTDPMPVAEALDA